MGKIEVFETEIKQLGRQREVYVYLPDGYREDAEPYPVIYMQDGQNLFAAKNKIDGPMGSRSYNATAGKRNGQSSNSCRRGIRSAAHDRVRSVADYAPQSIS